MKFTNKTVAPFVLIITAIVLVLLQVLATAVSGETDAITHYQIARYAFKYPDLFLNHWGKPLYNILSSPFAQFGYIGSIAFNLVCGLGSGWLAYLIVKRLDYKFAWAAIIFTVFTPVYLIIMYTGLTEILFSFVLIAAIYLFVSERFIWSAVVISLIPFARTEGVMYIALFAPAFIWAKQYKALPFLLAGFVVFSIAGWPQYHDLLWFFTKMPYHLGSSDLYGKGSFWFYFSQMNYILNTPLLILSVTGMAFVLVNLRTGLKNLRDIRYITLYFLIIPSFFGFFLAQSFLWWRGLGVLASVRFMACIMPLAAIIATIGFDWIMNKASFSKALSVILGLFILFLVVQKPLTYNVIPMRPQRNFIVMEKLTDWLKTTPYSNRKAFYTDPAYPFYMDMDPFDTQKCFKIYSYDNIDPAAWLKSGELLIWDAQFAGYEGHLPFDVLMNNNNLRLMNIFTPIDDFTIIGGDKYKLAVFMKAPRDTTRKEYKKVYFNDFESGLSEEQMKHITIEKSNSGNQSVLMTPEFIYSPSAEGRLKNLPGGSTISLKASVRVLNPSPDEKGQIILVMNIEDADRKIYKYIIAKDSETDYKAGEWFDLSRTDVVERNIPVNGVYRIYVWYTGKNKIYVDDLKLEYMPVGYE